MHRLTISSMLLLCIAGFAAASPAPARSHPRQAAIPFANSGGIADWFARDESTLFIMDRSGRWYLASFASPCWQLSHSSVIGFEADLTGRFDSFGGVRTPYALCRLNSLVRTLRPAEKGLKGIASATR